MSQSKLETIFASDPGLSGEAIAWFENVHQANDDYVALFHSQTSERQNGLASKFGHLSPGFDELQ